MLPNVRPVTWRAGRAKLLQLPVDLWFASTIEVHKGFDFAYFLPLDLAVRYNRPCHAHLFEGMMTMPPFTREQLSAYLDDALSDGETAQVEQALRQSDPLRRQLRSLMTERDRGEHSIGAIWRRHRLTCPSRELLGNHLLKVLDADQQAYVEFHLHTVGCAFCLANLADLQALQKEPPGKAAKRRRRFFESSAGLLRASRSRK
jgi:hypothetical protein